MLSTTWPTVSVWHLLTCREQRFVTILCSCQSSFRSSSWKICCRAEPYPEVEVLLCQRAEEWSTVHSFLQTYSSPALGNALDQNCTVSEVYSFLEFGLPFMSLVLWLQIINPSILIEFAAMWISVPQNCKAEQWYLYFHFYSPAFSWGSVW